MMIDRLEGNSELKTSVRLMLGGRRMTHSVLLVGEEGLGTGFAARCVAADYLYPNGGAPAEALLRGECCRAVAKAGKRDSGQIETGIVREAISVTGMGSGGRYLVGQVTAMRSEIFNTSLSAEGRAVLLYHVERMNEESANALLKVMEEPPEGVLFLLTADSLAGVLPTIRSRCISFAVAPVSPADCARYCTAQGVDSKDAALYSELFDGHIGTVLDAARDEARRAQVDKALALAKAAAAQDSYAAAVLLAAYEKADPDHIKITDPGKIEGNTVFTYLDAFCQPEHFERYLPDYANLDELKEHYQRGGLGDVKVKKFLNNVLQETLEPIRNRRKELEKDIPAIYEMLKKGSEEAEKVAAQTLADVKAAMKINYFDDLDLIRSQAERYGK